MDSESTPTGFEASDGTSSPFSTFSAVPEPVAADAPLNPPEPPQPEDIRTCRICFDQVAPPYPPDEELGKLISPCVCKGSSRFVHEGCLQQWRLISADHTNFYQCPTCHYRYQFRRLRAAAIVGSTTLRFGITSGIMIFTVYLLGFVSEPIINTYLDPPSLILDRPPIAVTGLGIRSAAQTATWTEHMVRGLASLGLLGFLKVIYLLGPSSLWNLRNSGFSVGVGRTGRDRAAQISWVVVAIGVINFFVFTWRQVGGLVRKWMEKAADEILEVSSEQNFEGDEVE